MPLVNPLILKYNSLIFIICIFFFYLSLPSYINSKILKFLPLVSRIMNEEPVILEFLWPLITLPPSYTKPPSAEGRWRYLRSIESCPSIRENPVII